MVDPSVVYSSYVPELASTTPEHLDATATYTVPLHAPIPVVGNPRVFSNIYASELDGPQHAPPEEMDIFHELPQDDFEQETGISHFPTPSEMLVRQRSSMTASRPLRSRAPALPRTAQTVRNWYDPSLVFGAFVTSLICCSLTSHQKKRKYVECLEEYVFYLHDQLRLIGVEPVALECAARHTLSNRSSRVRSALLHYSGVNHGFRRS